VTHPFRKRQFRQISLNSAAAVRAIEKSSIIANRKSIAYHRAIDEPCALPPAPLSPPKGGSKREFIHLPLPFISLMQVIVDISNLVYVG